MRATWTRLDDGQWGVRVEANLEFLFDAIVGQEIEVERSDGVKSLQKVTAIVKKVTPRGEKRVRGRTLAAVPFPVAICSVEPREQIPFKKRAAKTTRRAPRAAWTRSAQEAREIARAEWRERPLVADYAAARAGLKAEPEEAGAESLADLLTKPYISRGSVLTTA
jgi:hypothetical protein